MAAKTSVLDEKGYRKFGLRDKLAYGAGDFGCNMSFALKGTLSIYWMQYMGLDQLLMAGPLLLATIMRRVESTRWQYSRMEAAMRVPVSFHSMPHSSLPTLHRMTEG